MDQLRAIRYFIKVVETSSFTKAGQFFNVPASSLSRRVADLEKSLGATLLKRSTRVVKLTEVGQSYYEQMCEVVSLLETSNEAVKNYQSEPMGRLSISAMVGFGEQILLPLMEEFSALYPKVVLDIHLSDELSKMGRDEVDIAIRGGYAPNERVVAIRLMDNHFIPAASPAYLKEAGVPSRASQLRDHKGLYYRTPTGPTPWLCEINGQWEDVSGPAAAISNAGAFLIDQAIAGKGVLMLPRWVFKPFLEKSELIELAIEPSISITQAPDFAIFLLYQKQRYNVPKIKAAVDFLVERVKGRYP
jgi:DNA-binding transcriptional LysR family regulator